MQMMGKKKISQNLSLNISLKGDNVCILNTQNYVSRKRRYTVKNYFQSFK